MLKDYELAEDNSQDTDCVGLSEENRIIYDNMIAAERSYLGIDFRYYKESTILRRIERRMGITGTENLNDYLDILLTSDTEKDALGRDFLIGVTEFFRDREAFESLGRNVLSELMEKEKKEIRIWSVACSTGEEAYTLAMMAEEYREERKSDVRIKIFATDANKEAITMAQRGIFGEEDVADVPEKYREKYFTKIENYYRVKDAVRKHIIFAKHDILRDAPFSKMDLIVCRNVFIYLKAEVQKRLIAAFYRLLNPEGALFLGSSESVGIFGEAFYQTDSKWKLYHKNLKQSARMEEEYNRILEREMAYQSQNNIIRHSKQTDFVKLLAKALESVIEAGILVNEKGEILHILNQAGEYMEFPKGIFEQNIRNCLKGSMGVLVDSMIHRITSSEENSISQKASGISDGLVDIQINKVNYNEDTFYLIHFVKETISAEKPLEVSQNELKDFRIHELEKALDAVSQRLQSAVEELESRNEELQSSNEEMIVSNEELQSTNEELKSVNEELYHVNGDYQKKIEELITANLDFDNLLVNAQIGALYIDNELHIRKITPIMAQNTLLLSSDVGRYIEHVRFMNQYLNFPEDVKTSLNREIVVEREVTSEEGITWLIRIRPYYNMEGKKEGALIVLFDVTKRLEAAKYELKLLTNNIPGGVTKMRYDNGLIIEYANEGMYQMMNMTREEFSSLYHNYYDRLVVPEDWVLVRQQIEAAIRTGELLRMEYRVKLPDGSTCWRMAQAMLLEERSAPILQCIISDITDLKETQNQLRSLVENIPSAVLRFYYDTERKLVRLIYMSDRGYEMIGYTKEEYEKKRAEQGEFFIFQQEEDQIFSVLDRIIQTGQEVRKEYHIQRLDGINIWVSMRSSIVAQEGNGYLIQGIASDITEQKESLNRIWQEQEKLHAIAEMSADLVFEYDICSDWMHYSNNRVDIIGQEVITEHYCENIIKSGLIYKDDMPVIRQFCQELKEGKPEIKLELRKKYADGIFHWSSIHAKTLTNREGKPVRVVGTTSNIDERKLEEEELKMRSERDSLTNLYNHMTIKTLVDEQLKGEEKESWLLIMDVDNFKQVNDSQGHLYGDAVLCSFADELNHVFQSPWTGRIGGDEFCVLAIGETRESICEKMELLNQRICKMCSSEGSEISISSSIGAARYQKENYEYGLLFKQADSALYYVKNHGKRGYQIFDPAVCKMDTEEGLWNNYEDNTMRKDALFADEQELLVFSLELLERVNDVQNAIKVICDRICHFFHFDDIIMLEKDRQGELNIRYRSSRFEERNGVKEADETCLENLKKICMADDKERIRIWNQEAARKFGGSFENTSLLCVALDKDILPDGYFVFWDRKKEHDWNSCTGILSRLANILCSKLMQYYENKQKEEHLAFIESYDALTQLPNYKKFLSLTEEYRKKHTDKKFFCTYSDFSNFQYLNETYGFAVGNEVLCQFAAVLRETCESAVYACHTNSDHFIVLHKGDEIGAVSHSFEQITKEFCNQMNKLYPLCKIMLVSGISKVDADNLDITYYIDNANVARKAAKRRAETCCMEFTDMMKRQLEKQMEMTATMQTALENGEFAVFLQPKIALADESIVGAEALVRWVKGDGTIIRPDDFIPLFEKNGFIKKVDFVVLEQVLRMLQYQLMKGKRAVPVSVNFSRRNQEDADFVDHIMECVNRYQVPPELVQAEVTESVYLYDLQTLNENMKRLKRNGVTVSIDDFGSGYSSLNILSKVSADVIKLDRQFLEESEMEKSTPEFLKSLVKMIKQLGFAIIAEGVETKEQIRMLKDAGCDQVQGYYYAKPMPMREFLEYLERNK